MVATKINKLAGIIASHGLTREFVAGVLKINRKSLSNKMNNPDTFTKREIDDLMEYFGVEYRELF